ncbi:hypothetical protein [Intestinibacter bartlettii]|uniref:Uncharacterized protein n=1 Tax=Intestinibacter bartlettii TaxID=261299 RepID=A0ABS6DXM7_9FIRM|nr:hypothetical protein [Intestinibacter bartlettii]MBU5336585.1 hypothetical protein [Intestinibacter bartlettii]
MATNEELKSAILLLNEIKEIYYHENDRNQILENKASVGLALSGILLPLLGNNYFNYDFSKVNVNNFKDIVANVIYLLILIGILFCFCFSCFNFYKSIKTKTYKQFDIRGFTIQNSAKEENKSAMNMIMVYKEIIEYNRNVNETKYKLVDKGMLFIIIGIILYIILLIINNIKL